MTFEIRVGSVDIPPQKGMSVLATASLGVYGPWESSMQGWQRLRSGAKGMQGRAVPRFLEKISDSEHIKDLK